MKPGDATSGDGVGHGVAVEARGLEKSYRDGAARIRVLTGIDLTLAPGELTAIVGPSGCGKSTLLQLLGTLDRPDAGEVSIGGRRVDHLGAGDLARFRNQTIGFVFQFHQLLPDFDAVENVMMPARIARLGVAAAAKRARELLEHVGLADRLDHHPSQLSGGERQRVAICRALIMSPALLLADEPTGNLDPASAEQVFQLFLRLQAAHGTTAVMVTHNPVLAGRCGRVLTLDGGRLSPRVDIQNGS